LPISIQSDIIKILLRNLITYMIENYFKKPTKETAHHKENVRKISDPVEDFRNEFDTMIPDYEIGASFEDVGYEPTEEEEFIFKNDPELQLSNSEIIANVADDEGLDSYTGEGLSTEFLESLERGVPRSKFLEEANNQSNIDRRVDYIYQTTNRDFDFEDFEDRDILSDIIREAQEKKQEIHNKTLNEKMRNNIIERRDLIKRKNNIESAPLYGKPEFKLMKKASYAYEAHQALEKARTEFEKMTAPEFVDKHKLNFEQIIEQINKFEEYQKNPNPETYSPLQLGLMKYCHRYGTAQVKVIEAEKLTKKTKLIGFYKNEDNKMVKDELPFEEIEKLAKEYYELRDTNFPEFVKCQVNAGIWKLKQFNWKKERYQDTDQWSSTHKENGEKPGEKITRKYITFDQPLPVENLKGFAYSEKSVKKSHKNPNFEAIEVKIHTPRVVQKSVSTTLETV